MTSFSQRYSYNRPNQEILIREDAPKGLREFVVELAYGTGYHEPDLLDVICATLHRRKSDLVIWLPDYRKEVIKFIKSCSWNKVYDIIEALYKSSTQPEAFAEEINSFFFSNGIGWQLEDGHIKHRGDEGFESQLRQAEQVLTAANLPTARTQIHEAINDLSRMPKADVTGAIQHALACLECVARESVGGSKETLGALIKKNKGIVPPPLDSVIEKVWGFSSEQGRHLVEGGEPSFEEAELLVGLSASLSTYLARKLQGKPLPS
ncbi:hypothetical protein GCM10027048_20050 [Hymenobacter coalescens]